MNNKKQPIQETTFLQDDIVICGKCKGHKTVEIFFIKKTCPLCKGEGMLNKVTKGTVRIFNIN